MFGDIDYFQTIPAAALRKRRRTDEPEEEQKQGEGNKDSANKPAFDFNA